MSQLTLTQALLRNLAGRIPPEAGRVYMTKEAAREKLVELTGRDFGLDVAAWKQWLARKPLPSSGRERGPIATPKRGRRRRKRKERTREGQPAEKNSHAKRKRRSMESRRRPK